MTPAPGTGLGLKNTRARLEQLYGDDQAMELGPAATGGTVVTLRFPYKLPARSEALA
jgi:LytS/YehU family sensor histidine kinase